MDNTSYLYTLSDLNDVCHFVMPNEKEYGMQNTIFRNAPIELEDQFKIHTNVVKKLFVENAPRDVVFMQVSFPGKAFELYDKEKNKLPITLKAYIELLKFFANDYERILSRSEGDSHVMTGHKKWLSLSPTISFRGPADICFKKTLERGIHQDLDLYFEKKQGIGRRSVTLRYSNSDMGILYIHPPAIMHLAKDLDTISGLQNYIGAPMPKKSRQS